MTYRFRFRGVTITCDSARGVTKLLGESERRTRPNPSSDYRRAAATLREIAKELFGNGEITDLDLFIGRIRQLRKDLNTAVEEIEQQAVKTEAFGAARVLKLLGEDGQGQTHTLAAVIDRVQCVLDQRNALRNVARYAALACIEQHSDRATTVDHVTWDRLREALRQAAAHGPSYLSMSRDLLLKLT